MMRIKLTVLKRVVLFTKKIIDDGTLSLEDKIIVLRDYFNDLVQMVAELEE